MARVLAIGRIELDEPQVVYNFTVAGPHTYFVLERDILVHNCGLNPKTGAPEPQRWAPRGSGHSRDLQRAFVAGLEPGEVMAVRGMDWGVWSWSRAGADIPFKPMAATGKPIVKGPAGYRHTNAGIFLADADVAWAIRRDPGSGLYKLIDNDLFHHEYRPRIGEAFRKLGHRQNPVLHGPHMNVELMFKKQGKTAADFGGHDLQFFRSYYNRTVFIYGRDFQGQTGYLGSGSMKATLDYYAPRWQEIGDGGIQIRQYDPPPGLDQATRDRTAEILWYIRQKGKFPR
jgi:hypothetical protein